jgi:hypothetical protein
MIIASTVLVIGLLVGAWASTTRGYRLGGVVVVPLLALYTLVNLASLPVFLASVGVAYAGLDVIQRRRLLYGRELLLASILLGMIIPVAAFLAYNTLFGIGLRLGSIEFLGSILPGIAAYNFRRVPATRRLFDVLASVALLGALVAMGLLAVFVWQSPPSLSSYLLPGGLSPHVTPLLVAYHSDAAALLGYGGGLLLPNLGTIQTVTAVIVVGLGVTELLRARLGLPAAGVVSLPLVALFSLRAWWVLPLYVGIVAVSLVALDVIDSRTFLYGRALLSLASGIGVVCAIAATLVFDLGEPFIVLFTGVLGGIAAYNVTVTAPLDRPDMVALNAGAFAVIMGTARLLITPRATGLAATITVLELGVFVLFVIAATAVWIKRERERESVSLSAPWTPQGGLR